MELSLPTTVTVTGTSSKDWTESPRACWECADRRRRPWLAFASFEHNPVSLAEEIVCGKPPPASLQLCHSESDKRSFFWQYM